MHNCNRQTIAPLPPEKETPVPRIPYPDLEKASPEVREMLGRLPTPANIFNMMAHAQSCVKPVMKLGGTLLGKLQRSTSSWAGL